MELSLSLLINKQDSISAIYHEEESSEEEMPKIERHTIGKSWIMKLDHNNKDDLEKIIEICSKRWIFGQSYNATAHIVALEYHVSPRTLQTFWEKYERECPPKPEGFVEISNRNGKPKPRIMQLDQEKEKDLEEIKEICSYRWYARTCRESARKICRRYGVRTAKMEEFWRNHEKYIPPKPEDLKSYRIFVKSPLMRLDATNQEDLEKIKEICSHRWCAETVAKSSQKICHKYNATAKTIRKFWDMHIAYCLRKPINLRLLASVVSGTEEELPRGGQKRKVEDVE